MTQFLSTLEVRIRVVGCGMCSPDWIIDFTHPSIKIDYITTPVLSSLFKGCWSCSNKTKCQKKSKLSKHFPLFEQASKNSFEVMK